MRLIPTDERYFTLLSALGGHVADAATLLRQLFEEPGRRDELVEFIDAIERQTDELAREAAERLDRSFITPIDREDIHLLATRLDTVVDRLDGAARRAQRYDLTEVRTPARAFTELLERAAGHLRDALDATGRPKEIVAFARAIRALADEADGLHHETVRALFATGPDGRGPDPIELIKWKDVYDTLEQAVGECARVAVVLESVAIKHG